MAPWWRGTRGEWYVVVQFALIGLVIAAPVLWPAPAWPAPWSLAARALGVLFGAAGLILALGGTFFLGRNLSVLPHPRDDAHLVRGGAYRVVRHPIYSGILFGALGWGLLFNSLAALLLALALFVLFDLKARREEHWLARRFPDYAAYRRRVRKLIPFIY